MLGWSIVWYSNDLISKESPERRLLETAPQDDERLVPQSSGARRECSKQWDDSLPRCSTAAAVNHRCNVNNAQVYRACTVDVTSESSQ